MSATATRDGLSLIAVIMRGETSAIRFSEAQKLLDYGFNNYEYIDFSKKGDSVKSINVDKGIFGTVDAIFENDSGCLIKKGKAGNVTTNVSLPNNISAPVERGQKLGEITYSIDENVIAATNIIAKEEIKSLGLINMMSRIIKKWFTLIR
ncbi:MAG: hypothetical protein J5507_03615 [Clostridia bacterium]|nr:hypothetical protein [Clostridia bacterium]